MFPETEERVDRLEVALERFITQTTAQMGEVNAGLLRLERNMDRLERNMDRLEQNSERDRREHNKRWGELAAGAQDGNRGGGHRRAQPAAHRAG
jgi:septal ring factor EnvC (AmiA/AmiB activator)